MMARAFVIVPLSAAMLSASACAKADSVPDMQAQSAAQEPSEAQGEAMSEPEPPFVARPVRPQPKPLDDYIGDAPVRDTNRPAQTSTLLTRFRAVRALRNRQSNCSESLWIFPGSGAATLSPDAVFSRIDSGAALRIASKDDADVEYRNGYVVRFDGEELTLLPDNSRSGSAYYAARSGDQSVRVTFDIAGAITRRSEEEGYVPIRITLGVGSRDEAYSGVLYETCPTPPEG